MASAKFHKDTKAEPEGKRACDCVANELVNNLTCAEIRKYDGDTKYRATQDKRIVDLCTKK